MFNKPRLIHSNSFWSVYNFLELVEFRWVFFMLILRDIKLRYRQTYLGVLWVVLQPLSTAFLLTLVFGKWMHIPSEGTPYMLFAFCGLVPWLVFSQSVQRASTSLISDSTLITKIYFPRLFIPLAATCGVALDFLISVGALLVLMLFKGFFPTFHFLFLPICTLLLFLFSAAINLFLSAFSVYYRDFKHIIPFLMQLWMYASPIVYPASLIPSEWRTLYSLNPLVGLIETFRWTFFGGNFPPSFYSSLVFTVALLSMGLFIFRKLERTFADII